MLRATRAWVERGIVRVKCLAQVTTQWPGLEPGPLDHEANAPPATPFITSKQNCEKSRSCSEAVLIFLNLNRALQCVKEKTRKMWKMLLSFLFIPSDLRHPNILLLMSVCNSPDPSQQGLVIERVERAFLGNLLHEE